MSQLRRSDRDLFLGHITDDAEAAAWLALIARVGGPIASHTPLIRNANPTPRYLNESDGRRIDVGRIQLGHLYMTMATNEGAARVLALLPTAPYDHLVHGAEEPVPYVTRVPCRRRR